MDDYLEFLAQKAFRYYQFLYKKKPQAYTSDECFDRIKVKAKYEEILENIDYLPFEDEQIVRRRFDELREVF